MGIRVFLLFLVFCAFARAVDYASSLENIEPFSNDFFKRLGAPQNTQPKNVVNFYIEVSRKYSADLTKYAREYQAATEAFQALRTREGMNAHVATLTAQAFDRAKSLESLTDREIRDRIASSRDLNESDYSRLFENPSLGKAYLDHLKETLTRSMGRRGAFFNSPLKKMLEVYEAAQNAEPSLGLSNFQTFLDEARRWAIDQYPSKFRDETDAFRFLERLEGNTGPFDSLKAYAREAISNRFPHMGSFLQNEPDLAELRRNLFSKPDLESMDPFEVLGMSKETPHWLIYARYDDLSNETKDLKVQEKYQTAWNELKDFEYYILRRRGIVPTNLTESESNNNVTTPEKRLPELVTKKEESLQEQQLLQTSLKEQAEAKEVELSRGKEAQRINDIIANSKFRLEPTIGGRLWNRYVLGIPLTICAAGVCFLNETPGIFREPLSIALPLVAGWPIEKILQYAKHQKYQKIFRKEGIVTPSPEGTWAKCKAALKAAFLP